MPIFGDKKRKIKLTFGIINKAACIVLFGFIFLFLPTKQPVHATSPYGDWLYNTGLYINNSSNSNTLTNYQVKVLLTSSNFNFANAKTNGEDLRFWDGSVALDYWIEAYSSVSQTATIWVEVPSISASSVKTITMYYGNSGASSASSSVNTFIREITGVVGAWNMDETSGSTVADSSGNSLTGSVYGSTSIVDGKFNKGRNFTNSSSDSIDMGTSSTLSPNQTMSYAVWMKTNDTDGASFIGKSSCTNGGHQTSWVWINSSGYINFTLNGGGMDDFTLTSASTINNNQWHFVVVTWDKNGGTNNQKIYIDGALNNQRTTPVGNLDTPTWYFELGSYRWEPCGGGTSALLGILDEARVYNATLTAAQVTDLYNNYGYTTASYAGKELVRKYSSPEPTVFSAPTAPTVTLGSENVIKNVSINPTVTGSTYSGDLTHLNTDWKIVTHTEVDTACTAGATVWSSLDDATHKTSITVTGSPLNYGGTYYACARYNNGVDSSWSTARSLTTKKDTTVAATYNWDFNTTGDYTVASGKTVVSGNVGKLVDLGSGTYSGVGATGDGSDGSLTVSSANTVVNSYTYLTGNESATDNTIAVNDASSFSATDEILIIQMQDAAHSVAGQYEFANISSKDGNNITLSGGLAHTYYSGIFNTTSSEVTQIVRIPQYTNVTINSGSSITASAWDGYKGGIVAFRASGTVNIPGSITVAGKGYRGISHSATYRNQTGFQGETYSGIGTQSNSNLLSGGGGGVGTQDSAGGAGGGYGTAGNAGDTYGGHAGGTAGATAGLADLSKILFGGAGGEGGADEDGSYPGSGGNGGGFIFVAASTVTVTGSISANGTSGGNASGGGCGMGGGGGGAGGAIYFMGQTLTLGSNLLTAAAGSAGSNNGCGGNGGAGGSGRIKLDATTLAGTTSPSYNQGTAPTNSLTDVLIKPNLAFPSFGTNTSLDFDTADEGQFVQQDATNGTDFTSGKVQLHIISATGGTITSVNGYNIHAFTSSGTFTPTVGMNIEALVVAGGGGGGSATGCCLGSGGGGAGGVKYNSSLAVTAQPYTVTVGPGGGAAANGSNSVFSTITATGGGRGGAYSGQYSTSGGSSGGTICNSYGDSVKSSVDGYSGSLGTCGAEGGGGGGAGEAGGTDGAGEGGDGVYYAQFSNYGASGYFGGGGGGSFKANAVGSGKIGGAGGGGTGANWDTNNPTAGTANTGGGGGGARGTDSQTGAAGGSGVVLIRYQPAVPVSAYYVTTSDANQLNTSTWNQLTGVAITQSAPTNTTIKWLVSFDGRSTWKYWNGSAWATSAIGDIETNGISATTLQGLVKANWHASGGFIPGSTIKLDFAMSLKTTDATATPYVDDISVNYSTSASEFPNVSLQGFTQTYGGNNAGSAKYQLSCDGTNWYYHQSGDGTWVQANTPSTTSDMMSAAVANGYIGTFLEYLGGTCSADFRLRSYLISNGYQPVEIDNVTLTYFNPQITPTNSSPADGAGVSSLTPQFEASIFSDTDGHTHLASEWIIYSVADDATNCSSTTGTIRDTGTDTSNKTTYTVPGGDLQTNKRYCWKVRYQDSTESWSSYSTLTLFLTNRVPSAPTTLYVDNTTAQSGSVNPTQLTDTTPAFSALYNDSDTGDIANKAQIQVSTDQTFASVTHWDSGSSGSAISNVITGNRSSDIIYGSFGTSPTRDLSTNDGNITYYYRIRFWDDSGSQGDWSSVSNFKMADAPSAPSISTPTDDATGIDTNPTLTSSVYSGDLSHTSSDWEVYDDSGLLAEHRIWYKVGDSVNKTSITLDADNGTFENDLSGLTQLKSLSNYWVRVRYTNSVDDSDWSDALKFTTLNHAPTTPTTNFSPANGDRTSSQSPTISWNAATDIDPDDTASTLVYEVCVSTNASPFDHCGFSYTSLQGEAHISVLSTLTDETTYYYQVRTKDDSGDVSTQYSSWSAVQNFYVNTALIPELSFSKTVGVNVDTLLFNDSTLQKSASFSRVKSFFLSISAHELFAASTQESSSGFDTYSHNAFVSFFIRIINGPELFYFILGLVAAVLIYIFYAVKKVKHIPLFLFKHPSHTFEKVAKRKKDGTYKESFSSYYRKAKSSKTVFLSALLLLAAKVALAGILSFWIVEPKLSTAFTDNNNETVRPGDILTYRVDWENAGDGAATSVVLSDVFPEGTSYIVSSAVINGASKTDASDSDAVTVTNSSITFSLGTLGEEGVGDNSDTGYVQFQVLVSNPNEQDSIDNTASVTYSESENALTTNTTTNPVETHSIFGTVYEDTNRNEEKENTEAGLNNISIQLYEDTDHNDTLDTSVDTIFYENTTNTDGTYTFSHLGPDTYFISIDETTLPGDTYINTTENGNPREIVLLSEDITNEDFGYYQVTQSISGNIYEDSNRDETKNDTEQGLDNIAVKLYEDTNDNHIFDVNVDTLFEDAITNNTGNYIFSALLHNTYFVFVDETTLPADTYGITTESGNPREVILLSDDITNEDFGYYNNLPPDDEPDDTTPPPPSYSASIGEKVWNDADRDIKQDKNENGINNVSISLFKNNDDDSQTLNEKTDTFIKSTKTDTDGAYNFGKLEKGTYFVKIDETSHILQKNNYTITTNNNPKRIVLSSNSAKYKKVNFGYALSTSMIGNLVWNDENSNQLFEREEEGLPNVQVTLYEDKDKNNTFDNTKDTLIDTVQTSNTGQYTFTHVEKGTYFVYINETTLPDTEYTRTTNNPQKVIITTNTNQQYFLADFGYRLPNTGESEDEIIILPPSEEGDNGEEGTEEESSSNTNTNSSTENTNIDENQSANNNANAKNNININSSQETNTNTISEEPEYILPQDVKNITNTKRKSLTEALLWSVLVDNGQRELSVIEEGKSVVAQNVRETMNTQEGSLTLEGEVKDCTNCTLTISVYSNPTIYTTKTDEHGSWKLTVDTQKLASGKHMVVAQVSDGTTTSEPVKIIELEAPATQVITQTQWWISTILAIGILLFLILIFILLKKKRDKKDEEKKSKVDTTTPSLISTEKPQRKKSRKYHKKNNNKNDSDRHTSPKIDLY